MGASVSSNVVKMITNVMASVSTDIIQKTRLSQDSSQIISVHNIDGDVTIKGNVFYQRAYINMNALMKALVSEAAQQSLLVEISQEAKALISGLNIGQFADANNTIDLLLHASIKLMTVITQTCATISRQTQSIVVKRVRGNVYIQDNVFKQVANIIQTCTQQVVSSSSEIQAITAKLDQKASAKAEGLSGWIIVAILFVIIGIPAGGAVIGGYLLLKYIFPIVILIGVILLVLYFYLTKTDMKVLGYSTFISHTPLCMGKPSTTSTHYQNPVVANEACLQDKGCAAYDWQGINVSQNGLHSDGSYTPKVPPLTQFFSSVTAKCMDSIKQDDVATIKYPHFTSGPVDPVSVHGVEEGDAYLNTTTSSWYQRLNNTWQFKSTLISVPFSTLIFSQKNPPKPHTPGSDGAYYVYFSSHKPMYIHVYKYIQAKGGWKELKKVKGPGLVPSAPKITNASGFKVQNRKVWLLYLGITGIVVGIVGTVIVFTLNRQPSTPTTTTASTSAAQ